MHEDKHLLLKLFSIGHVAGMSFKVISQRVPVQAVEQNRFMEGVVLRFPLDHEILVADYVLEFDFRFEKRMEGFVKLQGSSVNSGGRPLELDLI